jgi:hypothetical protein
MIVTHPQLSHDILIFVLAASDWRRANVPPAAINFNISGKAARNASTSPK